VRAKRKRCAGSAFCGWYLALELPLRKISAAPDAGFLRVLGEGK